MPARTDRRTRIIFTIGPSTESSEVIERMLRAGANVVRLNMAHATHEWTRSTIRRVREVSERTGIEAAVMMDIKGPEIRTGDVSAPIELKPGEIFDFTVKPSADRENSEEVRSVDVNYRDLINDIKVGETVLVDNGLIRLEVLEKHNTHIRCRVLTPGQLSSRRHINLPGVKINLPSFTEKDRRDTLMGIEEGIDYVALSFVREKKDIESLRKFLQTNKSPAKIIAKIEDQQAIDNLDDIIEASFALMVARGDLGIECPYEELPIIQRRAVMTCLQHGRPVIVATHMLESMIDSPMPTRAEITDVANAVFEQADCVMLSGETTVGTYPVECVEVMDKIARRVEETGGAGFARLFQPISEKDKLLRSAVLLANQIDGSALLVFTRYGYMAQGLSSLRPEQAPVFGVTNNIHTLRQLKLLWAVEPFLLDFGSDPEETINRAILQIKKAGRVQTGDRIIVVSDIIAKDQRIDSIQIRIVE